jgi:hypothetical protein
VLGRWQNGHAFERSITTALLIANPAQRLLVRVKLRGGERQEGENEPKLRRLLLRHQIGNNTLCAIPKLGETLTASRVLSPFGRDEVVANNCLWQARAGEQHGHCEMSDDALNTCEET